MKRRMSIEALARCHVAARGTGFAQVEAQHEVCLCDCMDLAFGDTFGETYDLNREALDLYEERPDIVRKEASAWA